MRLIAAMKTLPIAYSSLFVFRGGDNIAFDCLEYLNGLLKHSAFPTVSLEELTTTYTPERIQELYKSIFDKFKVCRNPVHTIGMILSQEGVPDLSGMVDPDRPTERHSWNELNIYFADTKTQYKFLAKLLTGSL